MFFINNWYFQCFSHLLFNDFIWHGFYSYSRPRKILQPQFHYLILPWLPHRKFMLEYFQFFIVEGIIGHWQILWHQLHLFMILLHWLLFWRFIWLIGRVKEKWIHNKAFLDVSVNCLQHSLYTCSKYPNHIVKLYMILYPYIDS